MVNYPILLIISILKIFLIVFRNPAFITNKKNVASADLISINDDTLNDRQNLLVENLSDWARKMSTLTGINSETQFNKFTIKRSIH